MAVDYTPVFKPYKNAGRFRYWCQTTIPLVYDDSKSYLELLYSVISYLNSTIEDVAAMGENTDALLEAYTQLQSYVNNYFDNLDVQEEINAKLDEMASDGTLTELLSPFIPDLVSAWLAENLTPTTPPIDKTLSIEGAGADAQVTGQEILPKAPYKFLSFNRRAVYNGSTVPVETELPTAVKYATIGDFITAESGIRAVGYKFMPLEQEVSTLSLSVSLYVALITEESTPITVRVSTAARWAGTENVAEGQIVATKSGLYNVSLTHRAGTNPENDKYVWMFIESSNVHNIAAVSYCNLPVEIRTDESLTVKNVPADAKMVGDLVLHEAPFDPYVFNTEMFYYNGSNTVVTEAKRPFYRLPYDEKITATSGLRAIGGYLRENIFKNAAVGDLIPVSLFVKLKEETETQVKVRVHSGESWGSYANVANYTLTVHESGMYGVQCEVITMPQPVFGFNAISIESGNNIEYFYAYPADVNLLPKFPTEKYLYGDGFRILQHVGEGYYYDGSNAWNLLPSEGYGNNYDYPFTAASGNRAVLKRLRDDCIIPALEVGEQIALHIYVDTGGKPCTFAPVLTTKLNWAPDGNVAQYEYVTTTKSGFYTILLEGKYKVTDAPYTYFGMKSYDSSPSMPVSLFAWGYTKATRKQKLHGVICWGDSLTAGAGGNGTNYPNELRKLVGIEVLNCGVGGETANTISARMGANNLVLTPGAVNRTIALADMKDVYGSPIAPLRQGNGAGSGSYIYVNGQKCTLSISQTSITDPNATYTISGYTGAALLSDYPATFEGVFYDAFITCIFVGQNGPADLAERIACIDSMIGRTNGQYIVLGLTTGTQASREAEERDLRLKYGVHFLNTRELMSKYALAILGLTPTSADTEAMNVGSMPPSILSDSVHFNANGYRALANIISDKIKGMGYLL